MTASAAVTTVDVLVVGGGAGGSAAAWQAATLGASVLVAEETPWLGGMITSAGVSAFDGNKEAFGSGFFRRLRDALEAHYGGPQGVQTGWISDTCFEPHVAAKFLGDWVAESGAKVWHGAKLVAVLKDGNRILGARFDVAGKIQDVHAKVTIDATEYGDVLHLGGVPYRLGREAQSETGEIYAPEVADREVQDLTMVATLKLYPNGAPLLPKPENYDPAEFDCSTSELCTRPDPKLLNHHLHDWESFLTYSLLPNDKHLLNWPFHSNDSPDTIGVFGTPAERAEALRQAKARTLRYVYYMQNDLGHPEWGLATDEYNTPDHLPHLPYMRESRRVEGERKMLVHDVTPQGRGVRARFEPTGIAIGDYFLDHHHSKMHLPPGERLEENYPKNAPFMIPYGSLVPRFHEGLLAAEKNISVSHIVNGCTRLQPCVMLTGQAAGAAAALAAKKGIHPRALNVRELQDLLINAGVALYPILDLHNTHPAFKAVQRLSMRGLRSYADSIAFEADEKLDRAAAEAIATEWERLATVPRAQSIQAWREGITKGDFYIALDRLG